MKLPRARNDQPTIPKQHHTGPKKGSRGPADTATGNGGRRNSVGPVSEGSIAGKGDKVTAAMKQEKRFAHDPIGDAMRRKCK